MDVYAELARKAERPRNPVRGFEVRKEVVDVVRQSARSRSQPAIRTSPSALSSTSPLVSRAPSPMPLCPAESSSSATPTPASRRGGGDHPDNSPESQDDSSAWLCMLNGGGRGADHQHDEEPQAGAAWNLPVLLPKSLWKPDAESPTCDSVSCTRSFGLLERRHHCRKCGGIYCQPHSSRAAYLIDTSSCDYILPQTSSAIRRRGSSTSSSSETGTTVLARVCDACWVDMAESGQLASPASAAAAAATPLATPTTPQLSASPSSSSYPSSTASSFSRATALSPATPTISHTPSQTTTTLRRARLSSTASFSFSSREPSPTPPALPTGPLGSYALALANGRPPAPVAGLGRSSCASLRGLMEEVEELDAERRRKDECVAIVDGDIQVPAHPAQRGAVPGGVPQSLAKSLGWTWSTF